MAKVVLCQSCGMPLDDQTTRGTEKSGALSEKYCLHCYSNGEWVSQFDFDTMYEYNLKRFKASDMSKMEKVLFNKNVYQKVYEET